MRYSLLPYSELNTLVGLFAIALSNGNLSNVSFRLLSLARPERRFGNNPQPTVPRTGNPVIDRLIRNMVYVEGGTFRMGATPEQGDDAYDDESPAHQVTLSSFSIGKYEVTQREWQAVMGGNPSYFKGDELPVESVSWDDCQAFIKKLNSMTHMKFRLPTEAEWEYAARGGKRSKGFKYAGSNHLEDVAWYDNNSDDTTHPVGTKHPNELGLYDMSGNVWEWCQDWDGAYGSSAQTNPTGPSQGSNRVFRGGGWYNLAGSCRVAFRSGSVPSNRGSDLGFRLVLLVHSLR